MLTNGSTVEYFCETLLDMPENPQHHKCHVFSSCLELLSCLKCTTDILIENKIYEREEKFQTLANQSIAKHPFGLILTRISKVIAVLTSKSTAD